MKSKTKCILTIVSMSLIIIGIVFHLVGMYHFGELSIRAINVVFGGNGYQFNPLGFVSVLALVGGLVLLVFYLLKHKFFIYAFPLILLGAILSISEASLFGYMNGIKDGFSPDAFIIVSYVLFMFTVVVMSPILFDENQLSTKDIVEIAMLVAAAIVLDLPFLKFRLQPNGGSVSLEMVPLVILAIRHGPIKGFMGCGVIYGFISCVTGSSGLAYFVFDYLLAFGAIAIVGFFSPLVLPKDGDTKYRIKPLMIFEFAILLASIVKYFCHVLSGVIFWETTFVDSLIYSATYVPASMAITMVAIALLYKPILVINKLYRVAR